MISILWGYIDPELSHKAFSNAKKIYGTSECLAIIKRNGGTSCLITMSQDIFSSHFKKYGFYFVFSSTYPPNTSGDIKTLTPNDKPIIPRNLCKIKNLKFEESIAFGDSLSDEPLFSLLTETIAINATETLKNISKYSYEGKTWSSTDNGYNYGHTLPSLHSLTPHNSHITNELTDNNAEAMRDSRLFLSESSSWELSKTGQFTIEPQFTIPQNSQVPKAMIHYVVEVSSGKLKVCNCCEHLPRMLGLI
ncbi:HAD hydrolase family protein [Vibrio sp. F74]|uniref:HAD hydrolase family protein n=1 Tax=Vibrio sp. F74 TaxID=700020 RepID=UPI0035F5F0BA